MSPEVHANFAVKDHIRMLMKAVTECVRTERIIEIKSHQHLACECTWNHMHLLPFLATPPRLRF